MVLKSLAMSKSSSCSSLLERLRAHSMWQVEKKLTTEALLRTNINPTVQCQIIENVEISDSFELPISNYEVNARNVSICDADLLSSEDIVSSNYAAPQIENCTKESSYANEKSVVKESCASKFNYLKKGQGLKRFNSKKIKGFHKSVPKNIEEQSRKELRLKSVLLSKKDPVSLEVTDAIKENYSEAAIPQNNRTLSNNSLNKLDRRNFDAFEVLEELVEHDSFVSTSSRVNYLFQEDCSTPVPLRKSSFEGIDLTPITQPNEKGLTRAMSPHIPGHHLTPVRSLFSGQGQQFSGFERKFQRHPDYTSVNAQSSLNIECNTKFTESNNQSGILKKCLETPRLPSSLSKSSISSVPKVHFPNNGAKILEYYLDPEETISDTICSEDTDLVNMSDLENLKLLGLNYNFQIVHEVSSNDNKNEAVNQVFQKTSMNLRKCQIYESPKFYPKELPNSHQRHTKVPTANLLSQMCKSVENYDKPILSSYSTKDNLHKDWKPMEAISKSEQLRHLKNGVSDSDIEVTKILLLSKVHDLNKEIKMFKHKSETVDKVIRELNDEKKNRDLSQEKKNQHTNKFDSGNTKKKCNNVPSCNNAPDQKVIKLNERICNLKTENNLLNRKVVFLKKKESELVKELHALTTAANKKTDLIKQDLPFSPLKKNKKNVSQVTNKKALNQHLMAEAINNSFMKQREVDHEDNAKEIEASEELESESDSNNVNKPTYFDAATPMITSGENNNVPLSTKHHLNGNMQINYPDKTVYFYSKEKITQTRFKEGKEIIEFETGQKEMYFQDGSHQIIFPDKSCISVFGDGTQKIVSVDGTSTHIKSDGTKVIDFPNGQKEIYQKDIIERIYPDGTVKILYGDGRQETRYKNGQIRIKTKDGKIIMK